MGLDRNREEMRRDAKSLQNRLRSIKEDAKFVREISELFPKYPVLANERCGNWYVHPSKIHKPGVYFKSTDGHAGIWDFNLRRYNPHLIDVIIKHGGCIIVDSTRKGKRIPDALSKTIPIWCSTINNAVQMCAMDRSNPQSTKHQPKQNGTQDQLAGSHLEKETDRTESSDNIHHHHHQAMDDGSFLIPSLDKERWDTRHHSLPSLISRSEHAQINAKISGFAERLLRFTDLKPLTTRLLKPLRPIWLTPQSFLLKDNMPDYEQLSFYPVICLCASQVAQDGMEERDGYLYVQGSGDDEEMWSKGLTPELFWENEDQLLEEGITSQECVERAQEIVRQSRLKSKASNTPKFTPSMEPCSAIHPSPIWIGNNASGRIPESWEAGFDMVINCGAEIMRDPRLEQVQEGNRFTIGCGGSGQGGAEAILCVMQQGEWRALFQGDGSETDSSQKRDRALPDTKNHYYLHLPIAEGKKGQHQLLQMIPIALKAVQDMYEKETAIHSKAEQEPSTVYRPRILVHCQQGMDRSVGISLALLVQHFEETTGEYLSGSLSSRAMDKEMIQRRLFQIMGHRLAARPSRATLKMVNTYFMSPTDPPPAKFKSTGATNQ